MDAPLRTVWRIRTRWSEARHRAAKARRVPRGGTRAEGEARSGVCSRRRDGSGCYRGRAGPRGEGRPRRALGRRRGRRTSRRCRARCPRSAGRAARADDGRRVRTEIAEEAPEHERWVNALLPHLYGARGGSHSGVAGVTAETCATTRAWPGARGWRGHEPARGTAPAAAPRAGANKRRRLGTAAPSAPVLLAGRAAVSSGPPAAPTGPQLRASFRIFPWAR